MDTALFDAALSVVPYQATSARRTGLRPKRAGSGNPIAAPYQCFAAADADMMVAAPSQRLWVKLLDALDLRYLAEDERFRTVSLRSANNAELAPILAERFAAEPVTIWLEKLAAAGVPVAKVQGLDEAARSTIADERRSFQLNDGEDLVRLPWTLDGATIPWRGPAPRLGQHTREILLEAGYATTRIDALVSASVIAVEPS